MPTSIAELTESLHATTKRPLLVAIDGHSGAGKSTLAARLSDQFRDAYIVHVDDFYRVMDEPARAALDAEQGYHQYFDWRRLEEQVLRPLSSGRLARYQRYDWPSNRLAETLEASPRGLVIVEGVYSTRPELQHYYDLRVWVETDDVERLRRQITRDENSREWIDRWDAARQFYVKNHQPSRSADFIVAGQ